MIIQYISIDEVYAIHERMIEIGGGRAHVRDFALLHSAIERPKVTFGGYEMYSTIWLKAAALMHSLIMNHPFTDGNKRTGYFSTFFFLHKNKYDLIAKKQEFIPFCIRVDNERLKIEEIALWLQKHARKIEV